MQRALERFYGKITPGATALIFFRQNSLIPINAQIWSEQDVRSDGFPLDAVMEQLKVKGDVIPPRAEIPTSATSASIPKD